MEEYKGIHDNSILILLHSISHKIYVKHNELLSEYDLTVQQARILTYIQMNRVEGNITQKDIEKHLKLKGSSVSSLIKNMIEKGLVSKTQDSQDGRYYNLDITEKGMSLQKISLDIFKKYNFDLVEGISVEELSNLKESLKIIEKNTDY